MIFMKKGNLQPPVEATLLDGNADPINLTGATIKMVMRKVSTGVVLEKTMVIVSAIAGTLKYDWVAGDTDNPGFYDIEFKITFSDTTSLTVPNNTYDRLEIIDNLGSPAA